MENILSRYWLLIAAGWYAINGILHDIFVIINHKGKYDRELLRLLMDGHVLIFSGLIMIVSFLMAQNNPVYSAVSGIIVAIFMLVYCIMIFPFLKSFGTMAISIMVLVVCIRLLLKN